MQVPSTNPPELHSLQPTQSVHMDWRVEKFCVNNFLNTMITKTFQFYHVKEKNLTHEKYCLLSITYYYQFVCVCHLAKKILLPTYVK